MATKIFNLKTGVNENLNLRSEIENKLGRRLTKEEQRDWHTEMGNIRSRKATKGEKNPSLTEDELREAANDALDLN